MLAHEHAHLAARHHRWLTAAALVAQALPLVPLLRDAPARVGRLLEMDADELAAAHHEPRVIASALVAVATPLRDRRHARYGAPRPVPRGSAASRRPSDALARVQRLLRPPAGLPARARQALARTGAAARGGRLADAGPAAARRAARDAVVTATAALEPAGQ